MVGSTVYCRPLCVVVWNDQKLIGKGYLTVHVAIIQKRKSRQKGQENELEFLFRIKRNLNRGFMLFNSFGRKIIWLNSEWRCVLVIRKTMTTSNQLTSNKLEMHTTYEMVCEICSLRRLRYARDLDDADDDEFPTDTYCMRDLSTNQYFQSLFKIKS